MSPWLLIIVTLILAKLLKYLVKLYIIKQITAEHYQIVIGIIIYRGKYISKNYKYKLLENEIIIIIILESNLQLRNHLTNI